MTDRVLVACPPAGEGQHQRVALFTDGHLADLAGPRRSYSADLTDPLLAWLLDVADVEVRIVDERALWRPDPTSAGDRLICLELAEVEQRLLDLAQASELREHADRALRRAQRLEGAG